MNKTKTMEATQAPIKARRVVSLQDLQEMGMDPYLWPGMTHTFSTTSVKDKVIRAVGQYYDNHLLLEGAYKRLRIPIEERTWRKVYQSKRRYKDLVELRYSMMYWIHIKTNLALRVIGMEFNNADHSTVIHARQQYQDWMLDKEMAKRHKDLQEIMDKI